MFVNASEDYVILSQKERDQSLLYEHVASLAPAILPEIRKQMDDFDLDFIKNDAPVKKIIPSKNQSSDSIPSELP